MSTDAEPAGVVEDESFFRTLVEHGSDAISSIDADSQILFANHAVERVFGYEPAALVGEPLTVVMPERSGDDVLERLRERGLDCRVAMVTAVDPDFDIAELDFDTYVTKPVTQDEIRDTVDTLLGLLSFDDQSRQFFTVSRKIATLESEKRASELDDSDTYQQLVARREELDGELDGAVGELDDDDFEAAFRDR